MYVLICVYCMPLLVCEHLYVCTYMRVLVRVSACSVSFYYPTTPPAIFETTPYDFIIPNVTQTETDREIEEPAL